MTHYIKLLLKEPKRLYYYIQGNILWYIHKKYILKYIKRSIECKDCYINGSCLHCGCSIGPLFLSDLKCKKNVG